MGKKILGVTGCPTGIAHTYMAEESLKKAAKELGCDIKVETNGAVGVENALTKEDIENADAIIVACDKNVDMDRFNGKPVIEVPVKDGIHRANELIQKCIDGNVPIRKGERSSSDASKGQEEEKLSIGHIIYKHLMSGVSHMLPLVVAGGILTALSFLWGIYSADPTSDQYNVIAATLNKIGGYSMGLMVPVLAGFIAQSISGRPGMLAGFVGGVIAHETGSGFLGGILGGFFAGYLVLGILFALKKVPRQLEGFKSIFLIPIVSIFIVGLFMVVLADPCAWLNRVLMDFLANLQNNNPILLGIVIGCMAASDMGGPINKAAYVSGTMLLSEGNYYFMAGVSAACMTPPLALAIAATIAKNRFTEEERTAALVNYILGCSHITEGAIPFASKNPIKVIPTLMTASSVSAVLSYLFKITVPAPQGGFLVLGLVNKPLVWVLCILAGSIVGAIMYILLMPNLQKTTVEAENKISSKELENEKNKVTEESKEIVEEEPCLFEPQLVTLELKGTNKKEVLDEMIDLLADANILNDKELYKSEIYKREEMSSTDVGMGIAMPHAKTKAVNTARVAVGISKEGFIFEGDNNSTVNLVFMIAASDTDSDLHLKTLAKLSSKLTKEGFIDGILNAKTREEIVNMLLENNN